MNDLIAVIFEDEPNATMASKLLRELDAEGTVALSAMAIMAKDGAGKISVRRLSDLPGGAMLEAAFIGAIAGLVGGVPGIAVGAIGGALVGGSADAIDREDRKRFVAKVSREMAEDTTAVLVVITEFANTVEPRMATLGGRIVRG